METNTTKTLEELKKEAVGRLWEVVPFSEDSKPLEYLVMDIAEASYFAALDACRDALPGEYTMEAAIKSGSDAGAGCTIGHNYYRKAALSAIDSLRTVGSKETNI